MPGSEIRRYQPGTEKRAARKVAGIAGGSIPPPPTN